MESQLDDFERRRGVRQRWKPTDKEFIDAKQSLLLEKQISYYTCLHTSIVKRQYLLTLKAKYAGKVIEHTC